MTPEAKARQEIDRQLVQSGWIVQDHRAMNISAGLGVAVREFPLKSGFAGYLLHADGTAIGIVEANSEHHTLKRNQLSFQSSRLWISVDEISKHLGVHRDSLYKWIDRNNQPAHAVGRYWKSHIDEVDEWARSGQRVKVDATN